MSPERWREVRHLFELAAELTPTDREALLTRSCVDDPALRLEVETLLRLDAAPDFNDTRPARLGAYRLEGKIGSGGMSDVYLARRDDGAYRQQVAVKVIRQTARDDVAIARFRAERQILANLDHRNIARLLDGGSTPSGLPYLVIEYVDGLALDQYCDLHRLSIDARLQLLVQILDAVQFAHQNLVVHRDLKPSNVLVTEDGTPKLLDFGIAKMIGPRPRPHLTQTGQRLMTPSYASPEQIRGHPITTASDVYALGVILYEQLTSRLPYPNIGPEGWPEVVLESQPRPPSRVVVEPRRESASNGDVKAIEAAADARSTTPALLRRRLRGDLDVIVLKALRKEPQRRYVSAADLSLDLQLHLKQLPINSRPDTLLYRWGKFVQRSRVAVALSALCIALTVTMTAGFFWRLSEQVSRTAQQRDLLGTEVHPELAEVLNVLGGFYVERGEFSRAIPMLRASVDIQRRLHPAPSPELVDSLGNLGLALLNQGDLDAARDALMETHAMSLAIFGDDHPSTANDGQGLARLHRRRGEYQAAIALFGHSAATAERNLPSGHHDTGIPLLGWSEVLLDINATAAAEAKARQAPAIFESQLPGDHRLVAEAQSTRARHWRRYTRAPAKSSVP